MRDSIWRVKLEKLNDERVFQGTGKTSNVTAWSETMSKDQKRPMKEYEVHGSDTKECPEKSLDEILREAAREGTLHE